jgi:hypothetical protein
LIEVGYRRNVLLMRLLIAAGFTAAGLLLWGAAGWGFASFDAVLGAVVAVYFGIRGAFALSEILFPRPALRVGPRGIEDRRLGGDPIPWSAIREIRKVSGKVGSGMLFVEVPDPGRYVGPSTGILWLIYRVKTLAGADSRRTGILPLSPPSVLDLGDRQLLDLIQDAAPREIPVA